MSANELCTNNRDKGLILQAQEIYLQHPTSCNTITPEDLCHGILYEIQAVYYHSQTISSVNKSPDHFRSWAVSSSDPDLLQLEPVTNLVDAFLHLFCIYPHKAIQRRMEPESRAA